MESVATECPSLQESLIFKIGALFQVDVTLHLVDGEGVVSLERRGQIWCIGLGLG